MRLVPCCSIFFEESIKFFVFSCNRFQIPRKYLYFFGKILSKKLLLSPVQNYQKLNLNFPNSKKAHKRNNQVLMIHINLQQSICANANCWQCYLRRIQQTQIDVKKARPYLQKFRQQLQI
jgi:hypothetical protein